MFLMMILFGFGPKGLPHSLLLPRHRLPALTPRTRRLLASQNHVDSRSGHWGPLAGGQLWLLTLGPDMHTQDRAVGWADAEASPTPSAEMGRAQQQLKQHLLSAGCTVSSFIPPAAWLVAVTESADLQQVLQAFPSVRVVSPPKLIANTAHLTQERRHCWRHRTTVLCSVC